ncbi:MAG: sigma-70 family RNA polymerase sigma factor [Pseudomonadota bacterium]
MSPHTAQELGDDQLARVYADLQTRLRHYLRSRVGEAADDILQDVFVKALHAMRSEREPENLPAWLFRVARTTAIDHLRRNKHQHVDLELAENVESVDEQLQAEADLAECMRPLVQALPVAYRETLLAVDFEREPMKAIAARQGVSLSAIKSRASRGRAMLRDRLTACCELEIDAGVISEFVPRVDRDCC